MKWLMHNLQAAARGAGRELWYIVAAGMVTYGLLEIVQYLDKVLR